MVALVSKQKHKRLTFLKESKQRTFVQNWCFAAVCWSGTVAVAEQQRTTND